MRLLLISILIALLTASNAFAQRENASPTMLKGPGDWRFERLPVPPGFARDIPWTGYEEARFSPGMFDPSSANHFTYALSLWIDGIPAIQAAEIKDFLDKYFKGLSLMVGRGKNLAPDASQFGADVTLRQGEAKDSGKFTAKAPMFDTFNDGRKVLLNMEIDVIPKPDAKKTLLVLLISPQPTDAAVWKQLHDIRKNVQEPQHGQAP
jgi:hypothetical protein